MSLPYAEFYSHWLVPMELDLAEGHHDCESCEIFHSRATGVATFKSPFSAETKCCTYFPFLPNFTLGALFQAADPIARVRLNVALKMGRATPLGLFANPHRTGRMRELGEQAFGHAKELLCPFFDSMRGTCSIWDKRPGVCSSFYCQSDLDRDVELPEKKIWGEVEKYVNVFEWTLAHEALWRLGFTQDEIEPMEKARQNESADFGLAWRGITDSKEEFYRRTLQKTLEVSRSEVEFLLGDEALTTLAKIRRLRRERVKTSAFCAEDVLKWSLMNEVVTRQARLIEEFARIPAWEDRYKRLIEHGKKLPPLAKELHTEELKVRGCQSQVWLHAEQTKERKIVFQGDSDALIVKGLVALLLEVYSGTTADDILTAPTDFLKDLGFQGNLSPSRANGLYSMLKQILYYATAFKAISQTVK